MKVMEECEQDEATVISMQKYFHMGLRLFLPKYNIQKYQFETLSFSHLKDILTVSNECESERLFVLLPW